MHPEYGINEEFDIKIIDKTTGQVVYEGKSMISDISKNEVNLKIDSVLDSENNYE